MKNRNDLTQAFERLAFPEWLVKNGADCFNYVKYNRFDRFVMREHEGYWYGRMSLFILWFMGWCLIVALAAATAAAFNYILFTIEYLYTVFIVGGIVFGTPIQVFYSHSCDKIDYNTALHEVLKQEGFK